MKIAAKALLLVLLLALLAAAVGWAHLQRSLPQVDGEAAVPGIASAVEIVRDAEGVPHLFAKDARDGWFAMGYVHAQDRLWQMEVQRRIASGRIAELLGERGFEIDKLMRTLGLRHVATRILARLDPETSASLEAYAAGVNAAVAAQPVLPVEFQIFRVKPEPWQSVDTVAWLLVMAWDLSGNWRAELGRLRFARKLGPERTAQIIPPYPGEVTPPLPDFSTLYADLEKDAATLLAHFAPHEEALGSNNWALAGARTASGKPLLANDPHLGLQAPALWYFAHLATPEGNLVGGTLPGVPFVVLGRNDHLAWTMATTNSDTQDLYVERVAPDDPESYLTPQGKARFDVREEAIRVAIGAPFRWTPAFEERRIRVRSTRHGPVISDAVKAAGEAAPKGHVLALAWTALTEENATARAGLRMARARNRAEFLEAARDFNAPHQNVLFATAEGDIGFIAPAFVPVRRPDNEMMGRAPVPGWNAKYDWQGRLPFAELPALHNPPNGRLVTANNKVTPPGYKPFLSFDFVPPYRAERIEEMLAERPKHTLESFRAMQADNRSRLARELLPMALAASPATDAGRHAQALLKGWKGDMIRESPAPLVFSAWYRELTRLVYADELGDLFRDSWDLRAPFMIAVMRGERGLDRWCDDVRTPTAETCAALAARAFDFAATDLDKRYGGRDGWRWGKAHVAAGDHRPFGAVPVLATLFNVAPQTAGDTFSVNVGHFFVRDESRPFANRHAPSMRAIYDFADLEASLFMHSTGQSGNVLSPWYASFAERWADVRYITIPTRREALASPRTLTLRPAAPS